VARTSIRIAYRQGLTNVAPYVSIESMPTRTQLQLAVAALRREHGTKVFQSFADSIDEVTGALAQSGFEIVGQDRVNGLAEWRDRSRSR
jgi:uncharacterized protein with von Willebrand factor type A (vWA) domain